MSPALQLRIHAEEDDSYPRGRIWAMASNDGVAVDRTMCATCQHSWSRGINEAVTVTLSEWQDHTSYTGKRVQNSHYQLPYKAIWHHNSIHSLEASSINCYVCGKIWKAFERYRDLPSSKPWLDAFLLNPRSSMSLDFIALECPGNRRNWVAYSHGGVIEEPFVCFPASLEGQLTERHDLGKECWNKNPPLVRVEPVISVFQLQQARRWLRECLDVHKRNCDSMHQTPRARPTRLLYLGNEDSGTWRIVTGKELKPVKYITLSHCWGRKGCLRLTRSNAAELAESHPDSDLPRTFRDAVWITRFLGFSYLWIDTLCIMQGSDGDWIDESGRLLSVFTNSTCTIAASHAADAWTGIFPGAPSPDTGIFTKTTEGTTHQKLYLTKLYEDADNFEPNIDLPLNSRAWAFPESTSSPRILQFRGDQICWECLESVRSETEDLEKSENFYVHRFVLKPRHDFLDSSEGRPNVQARWHNDVAAYTVRSMTEKKDKLVALSGHAQAFATVSKQYYKKNEIIGTYLAGIWESMLPLSLLWYAHPCERFDIVHERARPYRAPSWSWAALDGKISYMMPEPESRVLVVFNPGDAGTIPKAGDSFGEILQGWLKLSMQDSRLISVNLPLKQAELTSSGEIWSDMSKTYRCMYDTAKDALKKDVFFLPICQDSSPRERDGTTVSESENKETNGLLLVRTPIVEDSTAQYQRIGLLSVHEDFRRAHGWNISRIHSSSQASDETEKAFVLLV